MPLTKAQHKKTVTIIEVAIVMMLISVAALIAIPIWQSNRVIAGENDAVSFLRRIEIAQRAFLEKNGDLGYGFIEELAGYDLRRPASVLPPLLTGLPPFPSVFKLGHYHFVLYLIGEDGIGEVKPTLGKSDTSKRHWIAYAWPHVYGTSGRQVFALCEDGRLFSTENAINTRQGPSRPPPAYFIGAALGPNHPVSKHAHRAEIIRWRQLRAGE